MRVGASLGARPMGMLLQFVYELPVARRRAHQC
jgi:hypothetical protein